MQQLEQAKLSPAAKEQEKLSIKERLLKKLGTYIDGIIINLFSAIVLGGGLYVAQKMWGLRLIPFNVLDAVVIGSLSGIGIIILLALILVLVFYRYFSKHPELIVGLILAFALMSLIARLRDGKPIKWEFPPKEKTESPQNSSPTS